MNKTLVSLLALFVAFPAAVAQTTQPCEVKQYNQKEQKTPLPGVEVMVSNAGTTVSDNGGKLTLAFRTLKPGDRVYLISAKKAGYELFNSEAVKQWNISRERTPFTLVLVKKEYFDQLKANLTRTSTDSYQRKYEQAVRELEKQKKAGKMKEEEFNRKYDELETQYQTQLSNLDNYIDQFSRIDLSEVSEEERRILEMVEEGRIEEAVKAYEELDISGKLRQARENRRTLSEARVRIEEEEDRQNRAIEALRAKQEREISTLKLAGGKENYDKIGRMLKENALADTTDCKTVEEYAQFAHSQKDYEEAERFYNICVRDTSYSDRFWCYLSLGELYYNTHRLEKAEKIMLIGNRVFDRLSRDYEDEVFFLEGLAVSQGQLGALYSESLRYAEAEEYYSKALSNYAKLFGLNPEAYRDGLASSQNSLGILYEETGNKAKAEECFLQALENYTLLFAEAPEQYREYLSGTQLNLGRHYLVIDPSKAEGFLLQALEHRTALYDRNPSAHADELASVQHSLGNLYCYGFHDYTRAEGLYQNALEIRKSLYAHHPEAYCEDLSTTQLALGLLCTETKDYDKAEAFYLEALESCTKLVDQYPDAYLPELATVYVSHGKNYAKAGKNAQAEGAFLKALDIYGRLQDKRPGQYRKETADVQFVLIGLYAKDDSRRSEYDAILSAALSNYEALYQDDDSYRLRVAQLRSAKGKRLFNERKTEEALRFFESAEMLEPGSNDYEMALAFMARALEYNNREDATNSLECAGNAVLYYTLSWLENADSYDKWSSAWKFLYVFHDSHAIESFFHQKERTNEKRPQQNREGQLRMLAGVRAVLGFYYSSGKKSLDRAEDYYMKALHDYSALRELKPKVYPRGMAVIQSQLGDLYEDKGEFSKAEECFLSGIGALSQVCQEKPDGDEELARRQSQMGAFYRDRMEDNAKARSLFTDAMDSYDLLLKHSGDRKFEIEIAEEHYHIGHVYWLERDTLNAENHYLAALDLFYAAPLPEGNAAFYKQEIADIHFKLGYLYELSGRTDEAILHYEKAPRKYSGRLARLYNIKTYEYALSERYDDALETIEKAIALMPEEANYYDTRGEMLLLKGDERGALEMWRKALELDPDFLSRHEGSTPLYEQLKEQNLI